MRFPVDEKANTCAEEAESKTLGAGLIDKSPEDETARRVDVKVLLMGILALSRESIEAVRRAGRGERAYGFGQSWSNLH